MMKLSTMWKVDASIDDVGRSSVAENIVDAWPHDRGSVKFFRSSANFLYLFRHDGETSFLRFTESSERSREAVEAQVDLLNWLAGSGICVALPVRSRNSNLVETVTTELGTFHAVVFRAIEGSQLAIETLSEVQLGEWGAALGKLHSAMIDYPGSGSSVWSTWRTQLDWARATIPQNANAVRDELDYLALSLEQLSVDQQNFGLTHLDFELDNLVWHDHTVCILDFDDCAHHWFAADIAFALRDLFDDGADLNDGRVRAFVRGYATHGSLDDAMLSRLPTFRRLVNLLVYARLNRSLDLPDDGDYPEWLDALRQKVLDHMASYRASLES